MSVRGEGYIGTPNSRLGLGLGIEAKLDSHPPEFSFIVAIMA